MNGDRKRQRHGRCGARRRDGQPCRNPAGHGTDHPGYGPCDRHGGNLPNHRVHAQRVMAEEAVRKFGVPIRTTATQALQDELERSAGVVAYLTAKVQGLSEDAWLWNAEKITRRSTPPGGGGRGTQEDVNTIRTGVHPWVRLLSEERRHFAEVARVMCALDIDTRTVTVAEQVGQQVADVLRRSVLGAGLAPDDAAKVIALLPKELRAINGGRPADERLPGTRPARVTACQP